MAGPTVAVFIRVCHLMMMVVVLVMLVWVLVMMLMVMLMVLVAVTYSGVRLRQELGCGWLNREWFAGPQGCQCWRQSSGWIRMSLPLLQVSGVLRQKFCRWRWHGEWFPTHNHPRWRV